MLIQLRIIYKLSLLVLCVVLVATPACAQAISKNYFPLADGARWEYEGRSLFPNGYQFTMKATVRVEGRTLIQGKQYFKYVTTANAAGDVPGVPKTREDVRYYRMAPDGIYLIHGDITDKPEYLEMPLPIPVGTSWLVQSPGSATTSEVHAERAGTIEAGGRRYTDCLKVTYLRGVRRIEYFYAPGVGAVKIIYVNTGEPKSTTELLLVRYKL